MRKKVYIVSVGQLDRFGEKFNFYDKQVYSSRKKALNRLENSIEVNKGTNVVIDNSRGLLIYDYNTLSTEGSLMTVRYTLEEKELY